MLNRIIIYYGLGQPASQPAVPSRGNKKIMLIKECKQCARLGEIEKLG
jgi:hypothetical protein